MTEATPLIQEITTSSILSALVGKNPATDKVLFSNYLLQTAGSPPELTRNTSSWVHNVSGITGIVSWNDRTSQGHERLLGGTAITKRHILYAKHAKYVDNNEVYFVTKDNTLITRKIVATKNAPYPGFGRGDYGIGLLEADLPDTIDIVKVLPRDSHQYFSTTEFTLNSTTWSSALGDVLILNTNQQEDAAVRTLSKINFSSLTFPNTGYASNDYGTLRTSIPSSSAVQSWYAPVSGGDSGSPIMMLLGNEVVIIGVWTGATTGPFISTARNYNDLNRLINDVDNTHAALVSGFPASGYTMTDIDLSSYLLEWPVNPGTGTALPLSASSVAIFEDGLSPEFDITWSFTYELSNWGNADELGFCMFLQDANTPFSGGGVGIDLGYSGLTPMSGAVIGIGLDSLGSFALSSEYVTSSDRDGIGPSSRKLNSIAARGVDSSRVLQNDRLDPYKYLNINKTISAFNLTDSGVKTLRARLGNYGRKLQVDYKAQGDVFYTNLLKSDIAGPQINTNTRYRPGVTFCKPLTSGNVNGSIIVSNFHVEGKNKSITTSEVLTATEMLPSNVVSTSLGPAPAGAPIAEDPRPLPFLGIEPDIGCPNNYCGLSALATDDPTFSNGVFPSTTLYGISAFIGDVDIRWNTPGLQFPIRFVYEYENKPVYDTGYVGSNRYDYGQSGRAAFITGLLSSYAIGLDLKLPLSAIADDGYPFVNSTNAAGVNSFYKDTDSSRVTLNVYLPLSSNNWEAFVGCPYYTLSCGTEDSYLCGLTQQHETLRKIVFPGYPQAVDVTQTCG